MTRPQEEQANLLGELAMLRNYKHPHLVEFIGTAMAVERGADTVRQTRQSAARPFPPLMLRCGEGAQRSRVADVPLCRSRKTAVL